ncbi:MAG TPA: hypothetical protein VNT81_01245 [Vicinamibacterales bacterium]|nr:hypothetical protein [Vicinamibacterales bacterium]
MRLVLDLQLDDVKQKGVRRHQQGEKGEVLRECAKVGARVTF